MATPSISVVVVSQNRALWLARCLTGLSQLGYPTFEVIVVADSPGVSVAQSSSLPLKTVTFEDANISHARNVGIAQAAGTLIAFIDDDAVPEPTWLHHIASGFHSNDVAQVTGTVLGRNGITPQSRAGQIDSFARTHAVATTGSRPVVVEAHGSQTPRVFGTNMAFRRSALIAANGFDTRYRFYLDETDLSRRIADMGGKTVFVPQAVVHHASAPSVRRAHDRTPRQVFEIAASAAVFHTQHTPSEDRTAAQDDFLQTRTAWLFRHLQSGGLTPDDVWRARRALVEGYAEGLSRPRSEPAQDGSPPAFLPMPCRKHQHTILDCTPLTQRRTLRTAAQNVTAGDTATVLSLSPSTLFHKVAYTSDGVWLHTGGVYGRYRREEPLVRWTTQQDRREQILDSLTNVRFRAELRHQTVMT